MNKGRGLHINEISTAEGCDLVTTYGRDHIRWRVFTYKEQGEMIVHSSEYTIEKKRFEGDCEYL